MSKVKDATLLTRAFLWAKTSQYECLITNAEYLCFVGNQTLRRQDVAQDHLTYRTKERRYFSG